MTFSILNEHNKFKNAKSLMILSMNDKKYLLYIVNDYEENDYNVMLSYLKLNSEGYHYLETIDDSNEFLLIKKKLEFIWKRSENNE